MDIVELLGELVSMNTVNNPEKNEKPGPEAARYIRDILAGWGIESEIIESNSYYSVYGCLGSGRHIVMFLAHYDVVPVDPEGWSYDPFKLTVREDKAYGRGALDDKANVAGIMMALKNLVGESLGCRICFAFTGDEEIGGANGAGVVVERLLRENSLPKYLVNGDGSGMRVITRRRKVFSIVLEIPVSKKTIRGRVEKRVFKAAYPVKTHAHAAYFIPGVDTHPLVAASVFAREEDVLVRSLRGGFLKSNIVPYSVEVEYVVPGDEYDEEAYDESLTRMLRLVAPFTRLLVRTEKYSEYGVSITPNMYKIENDKHKLVFDVRAMLMSKESIEESIREMLGELGEDAEFRVIDGGGGYLYASRDSELVRGFGKVLGELGEKLVVAEAAGASDSRYFTIHGVESVDFGPRGGNIHGNDEYVVISSLKKLPLVYTGVAKYLAMRHG